MDAVHPSPAVRAFWLVIAVASLALGALGVVVPVLPTTPFVLVAAYAAARSSTRLHTWLLGHRIFGPAIVDWQAHRAVSRRAKLVASGTMAVSAALLFLFTPSTLLAVGVTAFMALVGTWLWLRPERPRD
jgi:uncharacterized membrane protein YbaN (DUF454 family)